MKHKRELRGEPGPELTDLPPGQLFYPGVPEEEAEIPVAGGGVLRGPKSVIDSIKNASVFLDGMDFNEVAVSPGTGYLDGGITLDHGLADSGNRTEQYGGAVRDRAPGKGRFDLISPFFLQDLAVLCEQGAAKYSHRNWERGYSLDLCLDSAFRHLTQLLAGDDSEDHAVQAAWNLMAFVHQRHLIKTGALPEELADYVPLHVENPVTGRTEPAPDPIAALLARSQTCRFCNRKIATNNQGVWITILGDNVGPICKRNPDYDKNDHRP